MLYSRTNIYMWWPDEDADPKLEIQIIKAIHDFRLKEGLSQRELAKKLDTTQSVIARLESGRANPTIKSLQKIAEALGMQLQVKFIKVAKSDDFSI